MQPKETKHIETYTDYYVSPRKFIRYAKNQGREFTYSDNFQIQMLEVAEQLDNGNCKFTIDLRVEIIKSCFVQRLLITESEAGPKNGFIEQIEPVYE